MLVDTDGILNNHGREIPSLFGGGQSVLISALRRFSKVIHPRSPELIHPLEN